MEENGVNISMQTNAIGIDRRKLTQSTGRPKGARNLNAKHPSSLAKSFRKAGLDWTTHFALAIKMASNYEASAAIRRQAREDIRMWLRLLPYLVTTTNRMRVKKWKGKASKAAIVALDALEGKPYGESK